MKKFSGNDPWRGKNMRRNPNLTFSKRKNAFLIQGRSVYWSENSQKSHFCLKTTPFGVKMCERKSVVFRPKYVLFSRIFASLYNFSWIRGILWMLNSNSPHTFTPKRVIFRQKSHFCDSSLQYTIRLSWIRERFFALKMSNSDSLHVFTPRRGHFQKKFSEKFWVTPPLVAP